MGLPQNISMGGPEPIYLQAVDYLWDLTFQFLLVYILLSKWRCSPSTGIIWRLFNSFHNSSSHSSNIAVDKFGVSCYPWKVTDSLNNPKLLTLDLCHPVRNIFWKPPCSSFYTILSYLELFFLVLQTQWLHRYNHDHRSKHVMFSKSLVFVIF